MNGDSINLEEYTDSVTGYNSECIDVSVSKDDTTLFKVRYTTFRIGDRAVLRVARVNLSRAVRTVKWDHAQKIHEHFSSTGSTCHKAQSVHQQRWCLLSVLNWTECLLRRVWCTEEPARKATPSSTDQVLWLSTADVRRKLSGIGLNITCCNWVLDFLTEGPQSVWMGCNTFNTITLSTGSVRGCILSPLLFSLFTQDCTAMHSTNHIIKFRDDMTVLGLISRNDETAYREEVKWLSA